MKRILNLCDNILMPDDLQIKGNQKTGFKTQVIITAKNCRYNGSIEQQIKTNQTALCGRSQLLERSFGITPNMEQHIFLNDNILGETDTSTGKNVDNVVTCANSPLTLLPRNNLSLFAKRSVRYWAAGDGAMNKTILTQSYKPHSTDTRLYHMIPFRFVKNDYPLEEALARQYKLKVVFGENSPFYGYTGFYLKKINFDSLDGIEMKVDKQDYAPSFADTATDLNADNLEGSYENAFKGDKTQTSYIDMAMNISAEEFKEWFQFTDGTLGNATVSEIGLITGLDAVVQNNSLTPVDELDKNLENYNALTLNSEVYDAELFAHLTFDPYPVSREASTIDFNYRCYA